MRIAILGGPGSGKGTQAKMLAQRYRVPQISTGDLLRDALKDNKDLGQTVKAAMDSGNLVDNETVLKLLEERLRRRDAKRGFIVDGYPRNIPQAQSLDALLGMLGRSLQIAINVDVDDSALVKRVTGRSSCANCGAIYNKYYSPPKVKNTCDSCGSHEFVSRDDDNVKTVKVRIAVYNEETAPLITYYRAQHKLRTVNGMGDMDTIHQNLCDIIDLEIRPLEIKTLEFAADSNEEIESTVIAGGRINRVEIEKKKRPLRKKKKAVVVKSAIKPATKAAKKVTKKKVVGKKKVVKKKIAAKVQTKKPIPRKLATKKKPAAKKSLAKKAVTKKTAAKKKTTSKKTISRKTAAKKPTIKKQPLAKKRAAKKLTKKAAAKKTTTKKAVKKAITKKKLVKKVTAKKSSAPRGKIAVKKKVSKKVTKKKSAPAKKTPAKKKVVKKSARKTTKKITAKVQPKKLAKKKTSRRKTQ